MRLSEAYSLGWHTLMCVSTAAWACAHLIDCQLLTGQEARLGLALARAPWPRVAIWVGIGAGRGAPSRHFLPHCSVRFGPDLGVLAWRVGGPESTMTSTSAAGAAPRETERQGVGLSRTPPGPWAIAEGGHFLLSPRGSQVGPIFGSTYL